ncbi:MAG: hypothetical protein LC650_00250 [Actinobacteria bacterium]|nr:hypothetical protein [Actinomycetota bacterium]
MAEFGDVYGYKTNAGLVVAFAEGDEYADGGDTKVDLVLTGQSSGGARRKGVVVGTGVNEAQDAVTINT